MYLKYTRFVRLMKLFYTFNDAYNINYASKHKRTKKNALYIQRLYLLLFSWFTMVKSKA